MRLSQVLSANSLFMFYYYTGRDRYFSFTVNLGYVSLKFFLLFDLLEMRTSISSRILHISLTL